MKIFAYGSEGLEGYLDSKELEREILSLVNALSVKYLYMCEEYQRKLFTESAGKADNYMIKVIDENEGDDYDYRELRIEITVNSGSSDGLQYDFKVETNYEFEFKTIETKMLTGVIDLTSITDEWVKVDVNNLKPSDCEYSMILLQSIAKMMLDSKLYRFIKAEELISKNKDNILDYCGHTRIVKEWEGFICDIKYCVDKYKTSKFNNPVYDCDYVDVLLLHKELIQMKKAITEKMKENYEHANALGMAYNKLIEYMINCQLEIRGYDGLIEIQLLNN